jgi:hypothetical protein
MADGICALERSVRTVGVSTDGHGRDAVAARSPVATPKAAAFSSRRHCKATRSMPASPSCSPAWRSAGGRERDRQVDQESVKIARRDRTTEARAVRQVIAAGPLPGDLRQAIDAISRPG